MTSGDDTFTLAGDTPGETWQGCLTQPPAEWLEIVEEEGSTVEAEIEDLLDLVFDYAVALWDYAYADDPEGARLDRETAREHLLFEVATAREDEEL
jgi:hypothetical protein